MADEIQVNEHWTTRPVLRNKTQIRRLLKLLDGRAYIGGSYAAYACTSTSVKPGDIDVFATTDDCAEKIIDDLTMVARPYWIEERNDIVSTMRNGHGLNIQVIRPSPKWKTFPDDLLNDFDLDVCRAVIISPVEVLCDENAGWISGKVLRVNNPLRTFKRIMKYSARGVSFMDHELLKVFRAWDEMPAEKKEVWIKEAADELIPEEIFDSSFTDDDDWFEGE